MYKKINFITSLHHMINKPQHIKKENNISKFIKSVILTGTTLLVLLQPGYSKNNEKVKAALKNTLEQYDAKTYEVQESDKNTTNVTTYEQTQKGLDGNNDALTFASSNVSKYYPDMKEHVDSLINNFRDQEQKDTVNFLFQQHIFKNIIDPKKQVAIILYCLESFVFDGDSKVIKNFSNKYKIGTIIDRNEYIYLFDFSKGYNKRFKGYFKKLEQILIDINKTIEEQEKQIEEQEKQIKEQEKQIKEQEKQIKEQEKQIKEQEKQIKENIKTIEEQKKQIEGITNTFTINDVRKNSTIKKLVLDTEILYIKHKYIIPTHLAELIQATKQ